jgi:hypothetical protein
MAGRSGCGASRTIQRMRESSSGMRAKKNQIHESMVNDSQNVAKRVAPQYSSAVMCCNFVYEA